MQRNQSQLVAGLLIGVGVLVLLSNLGWLAGLATWFWGLLFLAGGAAFLYLFFNNRERWWTLIPGFALLALAGAVLMGERGGALFLALLGVGFAAVYATNRKRWWAIIPAGALATLAIVAWIDRAAPGWDAGPVFFLGLAATFAVLAFLPEERQRWAVFPALGLLAVGVLAFLSSAIGNVVVPLLLIAGGAFLLWRRTEGQQERRPEPPVRKEA